MTNRKLEVCLAAIVLISFSTGLVSAGAITVTNSNLVTGAAPTQGTITYAENSAACPPELPVMPSIGVISGVSNGTEDFEAIDVPPQELPGGVYNYRNYTVKNTTVSYNGTVTILTTGDVLIENNGIVNTTNSSITIISGGDILIRNGGRLHTADSLAGTMAVLRLKLRARSI
ncbi:MAG: hypothetical protein JW878_09685 [Methanomicrobia archaeon]|nr:hypothetical protein [Methanomicrobia archaeon]